MLVSQSYLKSRTSSKSSFLDSLKNALLIKMTLYTLVCGHWSLLNQSTSTKTVHWMGQREGAPTFIASLTRIPAQKTSARNMRRTIQAKRPVSLFKWVEKIESTKRRITNLAISADEYLWCLRHKILGGKLRKALTYRTWDRSEATRPLR